MLKLHTRICFAPLGLIALLLVLFFSFQVIFYTHGGMALSVRQSIVLRTLLLTVLWLIPCCLLGYIRGKKHDRVRRISIAVLTVLFSIYVLFWIVNAGFLIYGNMSLQPLLLRYATQAFHMQHPPVLTLLLLGWLCVSMLFGIFALQTIKQTLRCLRRTSLTLLTVILMSIGVKAFIFSRDAEISELTVARSVILQLFENTQEAHITDVTLQKLRRYGLVYNLNQQCITCKETAYAQSDSLHTEHLQERPPNIIVILFESASSLFYGPYNPDMKAVTPHLTAFAEDPDTTVVHNFMSSNFPSAPGYFSLLCSTVLPSAMSELNDEIFYEHHFTCLPDILRERGYEPKLISSISKDFSHKGLFSKAMGLTVLDQEDIDRALDEKPKGWGYTDHQLFSYIQELLQASPEPFFVMTATSDTHFPFTISSDIENRFDHPLKNALASTDDAFGSFWQEFKRSPQAENTIVIVVSDQAIPPSLHVRESFGKYSDRLQNEDLFDETMFLLHVPKSTVPQTIEMPSSNIDLTPTVLQLLSINTPNAFEGHSLFDDRKDYPSVLGLSEYGLFMNEHMKNGDQVTRKTTTTQDHCNTSPSTAVSEPLSLCELQQYYWWKRRMLREGRLWNTP